MTESRQFGVKSNDENFLIITDNGRELSQLQVCSLLNDLDNENEGLKQKLNKSKYLLSQFEKELEEYKEFLSLGVVIQTENKHFKLDDDGEYIIDLDGDCWDACGGGSGVPMLIREINKLLDENEGLKSENERMKKRMRKIWE